jgi:GTP-binding protein Era
VEAGNFTLADAKVLSLSSPASRAILIANKLDNMHRRGDIAPWLRDMQSAMPSPSSCRCRPRTPRTSSACFDICAKYLPEQPWWYGEDELTDRSEKFLAGETVREKLFRLTGDELPYTSTVVIDKFEEEPSPEGSSAWCASPPPSWSSATATRPW